MYSDGAFPSSTHLSEVGASGAAAASSDTCRAWSCSATGVTCVFGRENALDEVLRDCCICSPAGAVKLPQIFDDSVSACKDKPRGSLCEVR